MVNRRRPRAAAVLALSLAFVLAACSSGPSDNQTGGGGQDTLTVALPSFQEDALDPKYIGGATAPTLVSQMYDYLTWLDADNNIVPGVAESWEMSEDRLTWTFELRDGMTFHNGEALTAEDIEFTMQRVLEDDARSRYHESFKALIKTMTVVDDQTIRFELNAPDPDFLRILGPNFGTVEIVPKDYFEEVGADGFGSAPVGSGPWKFVSHEPGSRLEYEAVEQHPFRTVPSFQRLVMLLVPEESTRIAMLDRGEVTIAEVSAERAEELEGRGHEVREIPGLNQVGVYYWLPWVDPSAPTADVRVKKALAHAVDAAAIREAMFEGRAQPSLPWGVFPGSYYADPNRESQQPLEYDVDEARRLLAEAGFADGFEITLWAPSGVEGAPFLPEMAEIVADYWREIGVTATLQPVEWAEYRGMYRARDPRLNNTATTWRLPALLDTNFMCADGNGIIRTDGPNPVNDNTRVDQLCRQALSAATEEERRQAMQQAVDVLFEEVYRGQTIAYTGVFWGMDPEVVGDWTLIESFSGLGPIYETIQPAG